MEEETPEVFLLGIHPTSNEEDIRRCCSSFGDVVRIKLNKKDGAFNGYVYRS
jgi:hypothetical protein